MKYSSTASVSSIPKRQILLMDLETLEEFDLFAGQIRENVTVEGLEFSEFHEGDEYTVDVFSYNYENTNSSMILHISNLDTDFEFFKLVIRARVANSFVNYEYGTYSTETKKIPIDFIDPELPTITSSKLLIDNPIFEKSAGMFVVNDYLIRSQPTEYFDFNYQPLANQIATYWTTATFPDDYYRNGGKNFSMVNTNKSIFLIL